MKSLQLLIIIFLVTFLNGCAQLEYSNNCSDKKELTKVDTDLLAPFDTDDFKSSNYASLCKDDHGPLFDNRYSPYMGGIKNVDIVVEHFSNIRCVHCANFSNEYKKIWSENSEINNRVRIYFHPLSMIDDEDSYSAMFSAGLQGMDNFWKMEEFAFGNIGLGVTYQDLYDFASQSLQIDMTEFEKHTTLETSEGKAIYNYIYRERDEAITNCINYTPAIFVCGNPIEKWSDLEDTLMSYLNESR